MSALEGIRRDIENVRADLAEVSQVVHDIQERLDAEDARRISDAPAPQATASRSTTPPPRTSSPSPTKSSATEMKSGTAKP